MDKAEAVAAKGKKNAAPFITSARTRTFNRLLGIKDEAAGFKKVKNPKAQTPENNLFSKPPGAKGVI